jgi:hypothetical protein
MSVSITYIHVPGRAYVNKWLDARLTIHAGKNVNNMGITMCYLGTGEMYVKRKGYDETYSVANCSGEGGYKPIFYRSGTSSTCTSINIELQYMYTATETTTLDIVAGYFDVERRIFYIEDEKRFEILFEKPPFIDKGDLMILVPAVAVPTGIGVATKRTALGAGIGISAAGAYIGYKLYRWYRG